MAVQVQINNLFFTGYVVRFDNGDNPLLERFKIDYKDNKGDQYHVVKDNERLDLIAYNYYGDSLLWWVIADVNEIYNPLEITPGDSLLIPEFEKVKALSL